LITPIIMTRFKRIFINLICFIFVLSFSGCTEVTEGYDQSYTFLYKVYLEDVEESEKKEVVEELKNELKDRASENNANIEIIEEERDGDYYLDLDIETAGETNVNLIREWLEVDALFKVFIENNIYTELNDLEDIKAQIEKDKQVIRNHAEAVLKRIKEGDDFQIVGYEEELNNIMYVAYDEFDWQSIDKFKESLKPKLLELSSGEYVDNVIIEYVPQNVGAVPREVLILIKLLDERTDDEGIKELKIAQILFAVDPEEYVNTLINGSDILEVKLEFSNKYEPYFNFIFTNEGFAKIKQITGNEKNQDKLLSFYSGTKLIYSFKINGELENNTLTVYPSLAKNQANKLSDSLNNELLPAPLIFIEAGKL